MRIEIERGFTLIELSIVLVIIGLIVGGILMSQSLIGAATVRAQITQIEKFNAATNTFYGKYGYLPGDIPATPATQFGFLARGANPGQGDGNGLIESNHACFSYSTSGYSTTESEEAVYWRDLSQANLIDGGFATADFTTATTYGTGAANNLNLVYPQAKIGNGNYVYITSGGTGVCYLARNGRNFFTISAVTVSGYNVMTSSAGTTVNQAFSIDTKVDDGFPQSGNVLAQYDTGAAVSWAAGGGATGTLPNTAAAPSATTCYDNASNASTPMAYSLTQGNGNGVNCALAIRMQAGD